MTGPNSTRKSPHLKSSDEPETADTPQSINSTSAIAGTPPGATSPMLGNEPPETIGSPFKRHRASMAGLGNDIMGPVGSSAGDAYSLSSLADGPKVEPVDGVSTLEVKPHAKADSDEEL